MEIDGGPDRAPVITQAGGKGGSSPAPDLGDGRTSTFQSLAIRDYRLLFVAGVFVFMSVQAQQIARGQLAYDLTGSNAGLGGVYLGFGLPMLLLTPFGGVIADRLPKRLVLLASQVCLVVSAAWIAVADTMGFLEYWMLIGASVFQAMGFAVYGPTRVAYTSELVERDVLPNALVLTQLGNSGTRVFAPALAGVLIGIQAVGTKGVYQLGVVLLLVAFTVTWRLPHLPPASTRPDRRVTQELADGVRYVWGEPMLRLIILTTFAMIMVGWPYLAFLPSISEDLFDAGPSGYGIMSSVSAMGSLAVTLWVAGRANGPRAWTIHSTAGTCLGIGLLLLAASPTFGVALAALVVVGGSASGYMSMNNTLALVNSDLDYHGRVQSLIMLSFSGFGMAALPLGALADGLGLRPTLTGMGAICFCTMTVYTLRRRRVQGVVDLETAPI